MADACSIRILSVEDHPLFREGLKAIIGSQPDIVLIGLAGNAEQAVAEFRRHRPDVTLMDVRLPGTNGTDALIAIRVIPDQRRVDGCAGTSRRRARTDHALAGVSMCALKKNE